MIARFSLLLAGLVASYPAAACSIIVPEGYEGSREQRQNVRKVIEQASLIVDGEVVRRWTPTQPALVRVHHILKGAAGEFVEVGGRGAGGDCSIALDREGQRSRMILTGGPERYDLYRDQSEARLEDRILKSDRRKIWPYTSGDSATN